MLAVDKSLTFSIANTPDTGEPIFCLSARVVKRLTAHASADITRGALNSVLMEYDPADGVGRIVATDGHRLAIIVATAWKHDRPTVAKRVTLPAGILESAIKGARGVSVAPNCTEAKVSSLSAGPTRDTLAPSMTATVPLGSGEYPPWERAVSEGFGSAETRAGAWGMSAGYIADACALAGEFAAERTNGVVVYAPADPLSPMVVRGQALDDGPAASVVIMPQRL